MPRIDIHTTLGFYPRPKKHEILVITRGATASINFDLTDKVYKIDNIDQLTFLFKQGKNLFAYEMIEYFCLTKDTTALKDKKYYERIESNIEPSSGYKFIEKELHEGDPLPANVYYEEYTIADGEITENWQFNNHFAFNKVNNFSYVTLMLSSEETKQFNITSPDCNVQHEVAVRLNTDYLGGMHNLDSVIITQQHPIAVIDSLYSNISQASGGGDYSQKAIVSEETYCSETLFCNN